MALKSFKEWKKLNEGKKDRCPHPQNKEFCREYNRFINGERNAPPRIEDYEKQAVSTGHYSGPRSAVYADKQDKKNARKGRTGNPFNREY